MINEVDGGGVMIGRQAAKRHQWVGIIAFAITAIASHMTQAQPAPINNGERVAGPAFATRSPVYARNGAAATAHPLATQVALDTLKRGGSAVDAAIAANAALGFLEPTGNGVGGDLFALVWDPITKKLYGINGSGRAPMGMSLENRRAREASINTGTPGKRPSFGSVNVTVPGTVDAWYTLHSRFGKLTMAQNLAPAIRYAREGAPVPPVIAHYFERNLARLSERARAGEVEEFANARATYFANGAPRAGQMFANPDLARTLSLIARGGRDAYYKGPIAQTIDAYMRRIDGPLRASDFAAHRSEWVEPISVNYRGYDVWQLPPNSQGVTTLQMLGILNQFDMRAAGLGTVQSLHLQIEAKRLAFEDRARFLADPAFSRVPTSQLISQRYLTSRAALIDPARASVNVSAGDPSQFERGDTTFLVTADSSGMMVALIQSNYRGMGSGLVADGLGFMFQNRGEAFSLDSNSVNVYAPGKRPFHTIIPGFVTKDSAAFMAFGVMGGGMQPQGQTQIIVNMLDYGLDAQSAGDMPRWRHEGGCEPEGGCAPGLGRVVLESGFTQATRDGLIAKGWTLSAGDGGFGGYQAIVRDPVSGVYQAASESRTDGAAQGY
jgi:gamma-glutamyltranspeptidase / glutathione hydrolase